MENTKEQKRETAVETIKRAGERWPTTFVPRLQVPKFTGGLIAVGTLANHDSAKTGPEGAFKIGRQVCYPVDALVKWLASRVEV